MRSLRFFTTLLLGFIIVINAGIDAVFAQREDTSKGVILFFSPRVQTVLVGSTFDVAVFLDTGGQSINTVDLKLTFSPDILDIVKPSGGKSFVSQWHAHPTFSNVEGTASFIGGIPNGITTESGLVITMTFKGVSSGQAIIEVDPSSRVLASDGTGMNVLTGYGRATYRITPRPPEGLTVFSDTHPIEDNWYNNHTPVLLWESGESSHFSYLLDNKPNTIPDNSSDTQDSITTFEDLSDGLFYFHIKGSKEGIWGSTTHFPLHIDPTPPLEFTPTIELIESADITRALVSFSTIDLLSGIDTYEVGIIDKSQTPDSFPIFVEAQSGVYQLPLSATGDLRVIVRAIDHAGNVRDAAVDILVPFSIEQYFKDNIFIIFGIAILSTIFLIIFHFLFGHHIIARIKRITALLKRDKNIYNDKIN